MSSAEFAWSLMSEPFRTIVQIIGAIVVLMWVLFPVLVFDLLRQIRNELRQVNERERQHEAVPAALPREGSLAPWIFGVLLLLPVVVWFLGRA